MDGGLSSFLSSQSGQPRSIYYYGTTQVEENVVSRWEMRGEELLVHNHCETASKAVCPSFQRDVVNLAYTGFLAEPPWRIGTEFLW